MVFMTEFKPLATKIMNNGKYSLYLNEAQGKYAA